MAQSTITARVDEYDKAAFDTFCSDVGLNAYKDPFYSDENQAYLMKSINELKDGKGHAHELIEDTDY